MLIRMMNRLKKEEKGFTLIELLAVIVILAVIAAIAVPYILGVINKSKEDSDVATFVQVYQASKLYVTSELESNPVSKVIPVISDNGSPAKGLQTQKYLEKPLVLPSTKAEITGGQVVYADTGAIDHIDLVVGSVTYRVIGTDLIAGKGTKSIVPPPAG